MPPFDWVHISRLRSLEEENAQLRQTETNLSDTNMRFEEVLNFYGYGVKGSLADLPDDYAHEDYGAPARAALEGSE